MLSALAALPVDDATIAVIATIVAVLWAAFALLWHPCQQIDRITDLPREVHNNIFSFLTVGDQCALGLTSRTLLLSFRNYLGPLAGLPSKAHNCIFEHLDVNDQFTLRSTCKYLERTVDLLHQESLESGTPVLLKLNHGFEMQIRPRVHMRAFRHDRHKVTRALLKDKNSSRPLRMQVVEYFGSWMPYYHIEISRLFELPNLKYYTRVTKEFGTSMESLLRLVGAYRGRSAIYTIDKGQTIALYGYESDNDHD